MKGWNQGHRKTNIIVDLLKEKVTNVIGILLIERNENIRPQRNKDFMLLFSFGLIELVQMRLSPFIGICTMIFFHDFPFSSKAFHNF